MYKSLIRPFLFLFDPERIHHLVFNWLKFLFLFPGTRALLRSIYTVKTPELEREVFGLKFKNPIGLAAGFDKDARLFKELEVFGFGFIEVGTVTPLPQPGNDPPRMFRLPKDEALINRMGFNNEGVKAMAIRLKKRLPGVIIGGNIGKNKLTPNEKATDDYICCFRELFDVVDYFVVNVSSPNTPGLRELQEKGPLLDILNSLMRLNRQLSQEYPKPLLLKIAPDLSNEQLNDIVDIVKETGIHGVVATNTTVSRQGLKTAQEAIDSIGSGGLSGKPLRERSTEVVRYLCDRSAGRFPVIASGGIHSAADAIDKMKAGAALVQVYTGFIYEGPSIVKKICVGIHD
ncbi:MAG: quinone-dependent dihydroorotate dehydrogenase [Bacteroidia bacterium]|nr:quinone-dependent dihydroorotate dehydrogenase [Bacteroidia bacterium]